MRFISIVFFLFASMSLAAQSPPIINAFSPSTTFPLDTIVVTGAGFSSIPANLQVWFGSVKGSIISSTENLIEVVVPPQVTLANLEVLNLITRLSTKSNKKFVPYFSGNTFDPNKLGAPLTLPNSAELYDICSCDFNSDGKPDVASSKFDNAADILVLKNQSTIGTMAFTPQAATVGFPTEQITCGDLNGDGKAEIVASRSGGVASGPRHTIFLLKNTSSGSNISFGASTSLFLDPLHYARFIYLRDLNVDGKPEIIVTNSNSNELYIFINTSSGGDPTFNPTPIRIAIAGAINLYGLEVQDMNGDSKPEIIITQFQKNNIYILINQSTNLIQFAAPFVQNTTASFNKIIAADFNEDGKADIVASNYFGSSVDVWFNNTGANGVITFSKVSVLTSAFPNGLDVADIDGDKDLDIVVGCQNQLGILFNDGNNTAPKFTKVDVAKPNINRNVLLVDFDADGKPDIAHVNRTSNQFNINFIRNGNCFKPEILNPAPITICTGQTIQLKSIPGINITNDWKESGVSFDVTPNHFSNVNSVGSYTLTSTGENSSCSVTSLPAVVAISSGTVPSEPAITSNAPICSGQALTLGAPTVSGGIYTWIKPDGTTVTGQNISIPAATISDAGKYSLSIASGFCKSNLSTKLIDITNLSNFEIFSPSLTNSACQGSTIGITVTNYPNMNYQWLKNGVAEAGKTTSSYSVSASGLYSNRVTHAVIAGCSAETKTLDVKVLSQPVANFTLPTPACIHSVLNFIPTNTTDPLATVICSWNFGDGTSSALCDDKHTYTTAQSYSVQLTVSYSGVVGCTASSNKTLVVSTAAKPVISASILSICPEEETVMTVSGGTFSKFDWTPSASGNPLIISTPGDYSVITTDANGCTATANQTIKLKPSPILTVVADDPDLIVASGEAVNLTASGTVTYAWTPTESLDNPTIATPVAMPLATTTYTVTGTVPDKCEVKATITITVVGEIKIPNVFTPNGDGSNEKWFIPGYQTRNDCLVSIFDKSGVRVLEQTTDIVDWDGTYNGKSVPPGTYFYIITCPNEKPITGNILIAR